jgi:hypothetical protein
MEHQLPVAVVCRVLGAPRSTVYPGVAGLECRYDRDRRPRSAMTSSWG